jgi:arylformamidase
MAMDEAELARQYSARGTVPDADVFINAYRELSTPMYSRLPCVRDVAYGPHPGERLDLFPVPGRKDAPLFVFVHGGYWRSLTNEDSVFMAECFTQRGIAVASINYGLSPEVSLADIVAQCRRGLAWLYHHAGAHGVDVNRIVVSGSSAGGHLGGMLLAPGWQEAMGLPAQVAQGGVLVSGLFDLAPVQRTTPNTWLKLSPQEAQALSPQHQLPPPGTRLCIAVAGIDTDEFKRQSSDYAAACVAQGCEVSTLDVAGRNHFDVINDWMDPNSALSRTTWPLFE